MDGLCRMFRSCLVAICVLCFRLGGIVLGLVLALRMLSAVMQCTIDISDRSVDGSGISRWVAGNEMRSSKSGAGRHLGWMRSAWPSVPMRSARRECGGLYVGVQINTDLQGYAGTKSHCYGESVTISMWEQYETR